MKRYNYRIGFILLIGIFMNSCNMDIIENHYSDYANAIKNGFSGNGYIPVEFMKESMQNIRTILNVDNNEALIKFQISDIRDWNDLIINLEKCNIKFIEPKSFTIPDWWDIKTKNSSLYCYLDKYGKTFYFAIDSESKIVYSWNQLE